MRNVPTITIREFVANDIPNVLAFWSSIDGLGLTESDNQQAIALFLDRNPGFSALAIAANGEVIGAVLCGHNGRAAHLYHLAVAPLHRKFGVATSLLDFCYARLRQAKIPRCNIFVYTGNESGNAFWRRSGWLDPSDWKVMQKRIEA